MPWPSMAGGGGCGAPENGDASAEEGQAAVPAKRRREEFSAVARVGGSVAKYKADQESA
jgi:hypothetical protein